jgi:hypothetical protein
VARVKENFLFHPGKVAFALLDFDDKGMPAVVRDKLNEIGGFIESVGSLSSLVSPMPPSSRLS